MYGHATEDEVDRILALERRYRERPHDLEGLLELGVLYIEPAHREDGAIKCFERVLEADPSNAEARLWLAYCCIHYLMDRHALERAASLLAGVQADPEFGGAASMLKAEALEDMGELDHDEKIRLLEDSVSRSPHFVSNHERLSRAYQVIGRLHDSIEHLKRALANLERFEPRDESRRAQALEELVTGRGQPELHEELVPRLYELQNQAERRHVE